MPTLDRTHGGLISRWWRTLDRVLLISLLSLILVGAVLMLAGGPPVATRLGLDADFFVHRHWIFLVTGAIGMLVVSMLPIILLRYAVVGLFVGCVVSLVLVLFIGVEIKGASRWMDIAGISFQPSEFVKPLLAVMTAYILAYAPPKQAMLLASALCFLVIALLVLQPDIGMVVTVASVWMAQLFFAGLPWLLVYAMLGCGLVGLGMAYLLLPHVTTRIDSFMAPEHEAGYQVGKSLQAIEHGGVLGVGLGKGEVKQHLPDAHTDFIMAAAMEEFGLIALVVVLTLTAMICFRALYRALQEQDRFLALAIAGLTMQFGVQSMINIGVTLHLLPTKGMTLPFISYGGSSVMACALGMGMLLCLTRRRYGERAVPEISDDMHWLYHRSQPKTAA